MSINFRENIDPVFTKIFAKIVRKSSFAIFVGNPSAQTPVIIPVSTSLGVERDQLLPIDTSFPYGIYIIFKNECSTQTVYAGDGYSFT